MKKNINLVFISLIIFSACNSVQKTQPTKENSTTKISNNFINTSCNYSLKYSKDAEVLANDGVSFEDESFNAFIFLKGSGRLINVSCYSLTNDLKDYVIKVWQDNKDDIQNLKNRNITKTVGELEEINFRNEFAYQFALTSDYKYANKGGGEILKDPTTLIFVKHNNLIYEIAYLTGNQKSKEVLDSFEFSK
ncbi:MAG: hypothetical protein NTZ25_00940 [Candidatus Peregrinibacteria bacterium]|nr:hypothetical protein [Candidatus Peregrinibacteria bacterium]